MSNYVRTLFATVLITVTVSAAAHATAVRWGATTTVISALARGNAVAYDSINKVYLVVSSHGILNGRFLDSAGNPLGTAFRIQADPAAFAHFPRVAFSP